MWKTTKVLVLILSLFLCGGEGNLVRNGDSKEISKKCYYCTGVKEDVDNIAACSTETNLESEECSLEDHFDKCIVFQAFSLSKNTTIFKRECSSRRFCEERKICSDPDFLDCRYECCTGDLCNDFDFTSDGGENRPQPQPTVAVTTRKNQELAQSESKENVFTVTGQTTESKVQVTTSAVGPTATRQRISTSSNAEKLVTQNGKEPMTRVAPVVEDNCEDLDSSCSSYVTDPSHWTMFCKDNDQYTSVACRKTCKFCVSSSEVITTTVPLNVKDCKDQRGDCKDLKELGYCEVMVSFMKSNCGKTCEFCIGEATVTKTTRLVTEKTTTSELHGQEGNVGYYTAKPVNTERPMPHYRTDQTTLERTEKMTTTESPLTTDNDSQSGITLKPTTENEDCQDKRENCGILKAIDYCRIMTLFMNKYCRKTCGKCLNVATEESKTKTPESKTTAKLISNSLSSQQISEKLTEPSPEPTSVTSSNTSEITSPITSKTTTPESKTTANLISNSLSSQQISEKLIEPSPEPTSVTSSNTSEITSPITSAVTSSSTSAHTSQPTTVEVVTGNIVNLTTYSTGKPTPQISSKSNILPTLKQTTTENGNTPFGIPDEDCEDKRANCGILKAMDYCRIMTLFMNTYCRKTCGKCSNVTSSSTSAHTAQPTIVETVTGNIVNLTTSSTWKPTPQISSKSNILPTLKQTTTENGNIPFGIPDKDCVDRSERCEEFSSRENYCTEHKGFMKTNCPRSCGFCQPARANTSTSSEEMITTKHKLLTTPQTTPKHTETIKARTVTLQTTSEVTSKSAAETTTETTSNFTVKLTTEATSHSTVVLGGPTAEVVNPDTPTLSKLLTTPQTTPKHTDKKQTTPKQTEKMTPSSVPIQTTVQAIPKSNAKTTTEVTPQATPESTSEPSLQPVSISKTTAGQSSQPTTSKSIIVTKDCYDSRKECIKYAKYPGYCQYSRVFMEKHCPKSCGFCSDGGTNGSVPSTLAHVTMQDKVKTTSKPSLVVTSKSQDVTVVTSEPSVKVTSEATPNITSELNPKPTQKITSKATLKITSEPTTKSTSEPTPEITSKAISGVTTKRPLGPISNKDDEKYDVVFVIGAQNPNAVESFDQQKKLMQEIIKQSTLTNLRYGLVKYNNKAQTNIRMNGVIPTEILDALLDLLTWQKEGTRVDKGIKKALEQFGSRPDAKKRIVVFINGKSEASIEELVNDREKAERKGIKLIVVGMGTGYYPQQLVTIAPDYEDRVYINGTGSSDVTSDLQQGVIDTLLAIMQEDETESQGGIPVEVGPENPDIGKFGNTLRWKIWPWSKCVNNKQSRAVRCFHLFRKHDYHVIIDACIQHVAAMPEKERSC